MGQHSGTNTRYINPYTGKVVSDRYFRQKTAYRKFANELGITWQKDWQHSTGMNWHNIPDDIEKQLRDYSKYKQKLSQKITMPSKHKYAYVLGRTKYETKQLQKLYKEHNKILDYPKERGK
jgi:thymidylate kinase